MLTRGNDHAVPKPLRSRQSDWGTRGKTLELRQQRPSVTDTRQVVAVVSCLFFLERGCDVLRLAAVTTAAPFTQTLHTHVTFDVGVQEVLVFYNSEEVCVCLRALSREIPKKVTSPKATAPLSRWVDSTHDITLANFFFFFSSPSMKVLVQFWTE